MTETTPTPERPLVTFALFAYNQEKYIREAVEGAFSQTYEPLEIILSDDCSTDRTFEIMQEMAAEYDGPHEVRVRRSEVNLGLIDHVCDVAEMLTGEFVVLAAGDDISRSERTARIVDIWDDRFHAVFSRCNLIDEQGEVIVGDWISDGSAKTRFPWLKNVSLPLFVYGSSSAYRSEVLRRLPRANAKIFSEDTPLNLLLQLNLWKAVLCEESLVGYRVHPETLSNSMPVSANVSAIIAHENSQATKITRYRDILTYLRDMIIRPSGSRAHIDECALNSEIELCNMKLKWYGGAPVERFRLFIGAPKRMKKWIAPRLLGLRVYSCIKASILRLGIQRGAIKG